MQKHTSRGGIRAGLPQLRCRLYCMKTQYRRPVSEYKPKDDSRFDVGSAMLTVPTSGDRPRFIHYSRGEIVARLLLLEYVESDPTYSFNHGYVGLQDLTPFDVYTDNYMTDLRAIVSCPARLTRP